MTPPRKTSNEFNHPSIHHHQKHHHFWCWKTSILSMFRRLSIKEMEVNHRRNDLRLFDEPSSPKVSCLGKVKRNNRVIGYPAAAAPVTTHHHKHSKLKKLFSSKTLLPPTTSSIPTTNLACTAASAGGRSGEEVSERDLTRLKLKKDGDSDCVRGYVNVKVVDVGELDRPLPVVKKAAAAPGGGRDEVNLWKRRFNGAALKELQIEQIHLRNSKSQFPTLCVDPNI